MMLVSLSSGPASAQQVPASVVTGHALAISGLALTATTSVAFGYALTTDSHVGPYVALAAADLVAPIGPAGALGAALALRHRGADVSLVPSAIGLGASALPLLGLAGVGLGADPSVLIVTSLAAPVISVGATAIQLGLDHSTRRAVLDPALSAGPDLRVVPLKGGALATLSLRI
ncbi:MAG TPA: hypothetical protein ENK18_11015 [Deltaproteobacteria bacterium]|nr:hypothetical protein [Deltaproteobacteria bacterium]